MATLTYDPNELPAGELSAEEQDSLAVGEKMVEQQEQLLAGKYRDAAELEKAYIELQSRFSGTKKEKAKAEPEPEPEPQVEEQPEKQETDFFESLWAESQSDSDDYSDSIKEQLESISKADLAEAYLNARKQSSAKPTGDLTQADIDSVKEMVGGPKVYKQMLEWASNSFNKEEIAMFDRVMDTKDRAAIFFAVQALSARYKNSQGMEGKLLTGKAPRAESKDVFKSQAQVVRAMSDPRYDNDPAYREEIMEKLSRSNINF